MTPREISIHDYDYDLPEEKIAMHPPAERDASKLLIYRNGNIQESTFLNIDEHLPPNSLLVLNSTKVINARLRFSKESGAAIEIFCLEPFGQMQDYVTAMSARQSATWMCMVGGAAKWKDEILQMQTACGKTPVILKAKKLEKLPDSFAIEFSWEPPEFSFAEIIETAGDVPLPPYIKRHTVSEDKARYQTIFAEQPGSVAAPTAGLHFSEQIFEKLSLKNIEKEFVTLHVGAGTFKPVKAVRMAEHEMHAEFIDVDIAAIKNIRNSLGRIVAVGTTSIRTIESLYWLGVKLTISRNEMPVGIKQWDVYEDALLSQNLSAEQALDNLISFMEAAGKQSIFTKTQLLIVPGYKFRVVNMLVTNFHQPRSTLLLLIAAAVGEKWKELYSFALENNFRFLSYGDGNLIFINEAADKE